MQSFSESGLRSAIDHFKRAIELDPQYARAYASLAQAYVLLGPGYKAMPRDESYALTRAAASKALELDERLSAAHYAMSFVKFDFEFDWPAAETHLRRALELSPSDANAHQHYGTYLSAMGDRERIDQGSASGARARPVPHGETVHPGDGALLREKLRGSGRGAAVRCAGRSTIRDGALRAGAGLRRHAAAARSAGGIARVCASATTPPSKRSWPGCTPVLGM